MLENNKIINNKKIDHSASSDNLPAVLWHAVIFISAVFFTISSISAKMLAKLNLNPSIITFCRFATGLTLIFIYISITRFAFKPKRVIFLVLRGVFNMLAILLFYWSIKYTTITNANLLNMTYPIFVALLSGIVLKEHLVFRDWIALMLSAVGIYLVINPNFSTVNIGDLIGLLCGISASIAIIMLRLARRENPTATVLFVMFLVGTVISFPAIFGEDLSAYTQKMIFLLIICGVTGAMGQFAITLAFKHLSAFAGSISGTVRIVLAGIGGFIMLGEVPTINVIIGAGIIIFAIAMLSNNKSSCNINNGNNKI